MPLPQLPVCFGFTIVIIPGEFYNLFMLNGIGNLLFGRNEINEKRKSSIEILELFAPAVFDTPYKNSEYIRNNFSVAQRNYF